VRQWDRAGWQRAVHRHPSVSRVGFVVSNEKNANRHPSIVSRTDANRDRPVSRLGEKVSCEVENTCIFFRKEGKYTEGHGLQEANVSRPIFTKMTLEMAKLRNTMFGDPKLQFSLHYLPRRLELPSHAGPPRLDPIV
jgi:hypothetical protein